MVGAAAILAALLAPLARRVRSDSGQGRARFRTAVVASPLFALGVTAAAYGAQVATLIAIGSIVWLVAALSQTKAPLGPPAPPPI